MSILQSATLLVGTLCFLSFTWAVPRHFVQHGRMPIGMRVLSLLTLLGFGWFVYNSLEEAKVPIMWDVPADEAAPHLAAFPMAAASLGLFWWTVVVTRSKPLTLAFTPDIPVHIHTEGPYAYVRHPFYSSYLLFWVSLALAVGDLTAYALLVVMGTLYGIAASREEQKFTASDLSGSYAEYQRKTGMLFPAFRR